MRLFAVLALTLSLVASAGATNYPKSTLSISPNPAHVGELNTVSGCGYDASAATIVYVRWNRYESGYTLHIASAADGCLSFTWTPAVVGEHSIWIYQPNPGGTHFQRQHHIIFDVLP